MASLRPLMITLFPAAHSFLAKAKPIPALPPLMNTVFDDVFLVCFQKYCCINCSTPGSRYILFLRVCKKWIDQAG